MRIRLIEPLLLAVTLLAASTVGWAAPIQGTPPYPASNYITDVIFDWSTNTYDARGSDNWPTTWAQDGNVYTSWGDGGGFGPDANDLAYQLIGIGKLTENTAGTLRGTNLVGGLRPTIMQCIPPLGGDRVERNEVDPSGNIRPCNFKGLAAKTRGVLALGGDFFFLTTPGSSRAGYEQATIYRWSIGTKNFQRAAWEWKVTNPKPIIFPTFMQGGKNAVDLTDYFYVYATLYAPTITTGTKLSIQKGPNGGEIALLRSPRTKSPLDPSGWQYFTGLNSNGQSTWSSSQSAIKPAIVDKKGIGWLTAATYVKDLGRYLVLTQHTVGYESNLAIYEAPKPWGPFKTVYYKKLVNPRVPDGNSAFYFNFLANSFKNSGKGWTLVYCGHKPIDGISAVDGRFVVDPAAK